MFTTSMQILFFAAVLIIVYVYVGYPVFLLVGARLLPVGHRIDDKILPRVTMLISAFNEKAVIREKIENSLTLDYPSELLEIAVVSDASFDGTDEIVQEYAGRGVRLIRQENRLGKSTGLNLGVTSTSGDLLLFSDANAIYSPDAIRKLVRHFADPRVGYVVGRARYREPNDAQASAQSEGLYWKLESWLKEKESLWGSVIGGDGAIYAIRRSLYSPLRPTDINDFLNPLQIISQGFRGIYDPAAECFEDAGDSFEKEFQRKIRIISRSLNAVWRAPQVLLPWVQVRHWVSLLSHKLLRWSVPLLMILAFLSATALYWHPLYLFFIVVQVLFYVLALTGYSRRNRPRQSRVLYLPYYFCLVNLASLIGISKFFFGSLAPTWQTIRDPGAMGQPASSPTPAALAKKES